MTRASRVVGFDRTLELAWLDACAAFVAEGMTPREVRQRLWSYLEGEVPGDTNNSARGKTVTVLTRVWSNVRPDVQPLRDDVLARFADAEPASRVGLHWAMMIAAYPYFHDVALLSGRLLRLHSELHVQQLTRRLGETWGQRELIQRTAQLAARSMSLWGVLEPLPAPGAYLAAGAPRTLPDEWAPLFAEALLLGGGQGSLPVRDVEGHSALFPFNLRLTAGTARTATRLDVHRVGLDNDMVSLTESGQCEADADRRVRIRAKPRLDRKA